jgi:hypothetical protein
MADSTGNMAGLIVQLAAIFVPIVQQIIREHADANDGDLPTDEQVIAKFQSDIDMYLAEGASWRVSHPDSDA